MTAATAIPATIEQLETAILLDVVTRFTKLRETTSRFSLLVKFEGQPTWQALGNLTGRNMIRNQAIGKPTEEEEYLPTASAFECCGNSELRDKAKSATTVVLHTLKQMFKGERKREGLNFEDFQRHVNNLYPKNTFDPAELKLGLLSCSDTIRTRI